MTRDDPATRFIAATVSDPALAAEFITLLDGRQPAEAEADILAFASARDYHFDAAALREAQARFDGTAHGEAHAEDLPDEALEPATGGYVGLISTRSPFGDMD